MKAMYLSYIAVLVLSFSAVSSIMMIGSDTAYLSSADIGMYNCVVLYQDSVSIECSILLTYRGNRSQGDTLSVPLVQYQPPPPVEIGDTLLVFADSNWFAECGLHRANYTLMNQRVGSGQLNMLSDDDLARLQTGDPLGERRFKVKITVHFPLSEDKIEFAFNIDESQNEPATVSIPGLGLFEVDFSIRRFGDQNSYSPVYCRLMPINSEGYDYSRNYLALRGDIACYRDSTYYVNSQIGLSFANNYFLTYEDFMGVSNNLDLCGGVLRVDIETTDSDDLEISPVAYLALLKTRSQGTALYSINLLGISSIERFDPYGEWNSAFFTSEAYQSNLRDYEDVVALRIPDEPVDGLRSFNYCLFNLSREDYINADISRVNFSTGDSVHVAEARISSFTPEYGIRPSRAPNSAVSSFTEELLGFCLLPLNSELARDKTYEHGPQLSGFDIPERETEIDIVQEDGSHRHIPIVAPWNPAQRMRAKLAYNDGSDLPYNLWQIIFGEEDAEIQLQFNESGNASLRTGRLTFQEPLRLPELLPYSTNDQYLFLESQTETCKYAILLMFDNTRTSSSHDCRTTAQEILRNVLGDGPCHGTILVAACKYGSSSNIESIFLDAGEFEYFGNNLQ